MLIATGAILIALAVLSFGSAFSYGSSIFGENISSKLNTAVILFVLGWLILSLGVDLNRVINAVNSLRQPTPKENSGGKL